VLATSGMTSELASGLVGCSGSVNWGWGGIRDTAPVRVR